MEHSNWEAKRGSAVLKFSDYYGSYYHIHKTLTGPCYMTHSIPFHWHVQNATIPCRSCHVLYPAALFHQLFFHLLSPHLAIYFLVLPLNFVVTKFIYNTLLGILFSSILCTCPNQRNLLNLTVSVIVGFLTLAYISLLANILQFSFTYTGPKILLYTFLLYGTL